MIGFHPVAQSETDARKQTERRHPCWCRATERMVSLTEQLTAVRRPAELLALLPRLEAAFQDKSGVRALARRSRTL